MFIFFKKLILLQAIVFVSIFTFASDNPAVTINGFLSHPEQIVTELKEWSNIFNPFWSGIDGVDCGEPDVKMTQINYADKKITFFISLGTSNVFECYERYYTCEVDYQLLKGDTIIIIDKALDPVNCNYQ